MATYLLGWNPTRWSWEDLNQARDRIRVRGFAIQRWSCGRTRRIKRGDRAFLIRLGLEPRGIMAAGRILTEPYKARHWDEAAADAGKLALYIDVRFDTILNPDTDLLLSRTRLINEWPFKKMHWDTQSSGISIPDDVVAALEQAWADLTGFDHSALAEEVPDAERLHEGACRRIWVNSYERNPAARQRCLDHYGQDCIVCGFNFAKAYGEVGEAYVHVHHLTPLAEIGEDYEVDPIEDLRPVCPNCHAILHRKHPPYGIEEVKQMLASSQKEDLDDEA